MGRKKKELFSVKISLLGQLSIRTSHGILLESDGRSKKVMILIGYLIANREHPAAVDILIQDIWGGQESDDPLNVLKNLVYRARTMLKPLSEDGQFPFISYGNGTYYWNTGAFIVVDAEVFMKKIEESQKCGLSDEKKLAFLSKALQVYEGGFLNNFNYNDWVRGKNEYYTRLYLDAALEASVILTKENRFEEVIDICERAASQYSLDERLQEMLLRAYVATRRFSKALLHYNFITKLFYTELGVSLSNQVKILYGDIVKSISSMQMDLDGICNNLEETKDISTAYYCDYEVFKNIYRLQSRLIERTGQSVCIVLLTLLHQDGKTILDGKEYKQHMNQLKKTMLTALRRGDVVSQFSGTQFVLMLSMANEKNAEKVAERIIEKFRHVHIDLDVKIKVNIRTLIENSSE